MKFVEFIEVNNTGAYKMELQFFCEEEFINEPARQKSVMGNNIIKERPMMKLTEKRKNRSKDSSGPIKC